LGYGYIIKLYLYKGIKFPSKKERLHANLKNIFTVVVSIGLPLLYFLLCRNDPIHGDGISTVARASFHMYEMGWDHFFYPVKQDPGHPTLYPYLLAGLWRLWGGPNLVLAHFWNVLFGIGVLLQIKRLCRTNNSFVTVILVGISPLFVAQSMMVLTHLALTFFFLGCWEAFRRKKYLQTGIWASLMVLTHLEGVFLLMALAWVYLTDWLTENKRISYLFFKNGILIFALPSLCLGVWLIAHYIHTGWWVSAPEYAAHRSLASFGGLVYNFALIAWRLVDYGYGIFYIGFIGILWNKRGQVVHYLRNDSESRRLLILILILSLLIAVFLSGSIAHRYFLPVQLLVIVYFGEKVVRLSHRKGIILTLIVPMIALGIGNFFYYPFKCIGDANIVYRNYFALEKEIHARYPNIAWGTYAPLSNPSIHRYLDAHTGLKTYRLYEARFDTCKHILSSNLTCEFTASQKDSLIRYWNRLDILERGGIRVELWQRR
jgi:hypothetical protein